MLTKDQIEQTLKNLYIREQWKEMLTNLFAEDGAKVIWESEPVEILVGTKTAAYRAKNLYRLGSMLLADGKVLNVYEAEVQNTSIAENRVGLRTLVQSEIIPGFNDAAVAVFHSPEQTEWRFTFMSKWEYPEDSGKIVKHETHPKKFTYVLGPTESNRTARDRFYELQAKSKTLQALVDAFSVTKLSKEFFDNYKEHYKAFYDYLKTSTYRKTVFKIPKISDAAKNEEAEKPIRDFIKRLLGRIVFLYFLQKKGWLQSIWAAPPETKPDPAFMTHLFQFADKKKDFYSTFLVPLFFDTLNNAKRKDEVYKVEGETLGKIPYLNGGLFESEGMEGLQFKNKLFENLFGFFASFNFTIIEDSPDEREVAVDPEMLGHIFENLIEENKRFGTFYTPKEVVHFMTQEALLLHLSKNLSLQHGTDEWKSLQKFVQYKEHDAFIRSVALKINNHLDAVKICDPAIGSGAFPMGMLLEIFQMKWFLNPILQTGGFNAAEVKEQIIRNSIYGVDIDKGAIDIARLRFWLSLIVDLPSARPLPNFDYKFMQGNSLKEEFEGIPLQLKEEKKETKNGNLWEVNEPQSFYGFLNKTNIDLAKLEEDLFDAHDDKIKAEKRKELNKTEKEYIKSCIDDKLLELKTKIEIEWGDYRKKTAGLSPRQRDTLKASYQKRIDKLEIENDDFKVKAQRLREFDEYEKKYFLWHLYFKHVFDNGGFDIVVANPPYGVPVDEEFYKKSDLGSKDSYGFFIKLAIQTLLKPNGTLVYIVSDTWLTIKSHLQLRQLVLQNQLHKVVRLHHDTFGAVVNTCIISLSKAGAAFSSPQRGEGVGVEVLAADLTNLSIRKELPEFREKLFHLNKYAGEFNERYAVYNYPQSLISTNSNLPIFTASPKLFALMNDTAHSDILMNYEGIINQKKLNQQKLVELIEDVCSGIKTYDNKKFIKSKNGIQGYTPISTEEVYQGRYGKELMKGIVGRNCYVPFEKGGASLDKNGELSHLFEPTDFYIKWNSITIKEIQKVNGLRNKERYFEEGISFSESGFYSPVFRYFPGYLFANSSPIIFITEKSKTYFILGFLVSKIIRYLLKNYINLTVHTLLEDIEQIPIINFDFIDKIVSANIISTVVKSIEELKDEESTIRRKFTEPIDHLVYELYGLNEEDIQEVEYWWARRYPKLARFADTKPRLNVKDQQELQARTRELISRGENKYCEFKSSLRLDIKKGTVEKYIEHTAFKNIAAFLNSEGGSLIIGVDDEKNTLGLEQTDYTTFSRPDKQDEWSKHLDNLIQNFLGNKYHEFIRVQFIPQDGKTVAAIEVKRCSEAVWLNNGSNQEFYIRRTASAIQLSAKEAVEYIREHWK
ncbi:MAG TPA: RNA-binding domain-containing protein [Chitinophagaceae bacterium]|nr:RNA-binding domain-containing protein [Chitinophagaceae bacterium]